MHLRETEKKKINNPQIKYGDIIFVNLILIEVRKIYFRIFPYLMRKISENYYSINRMEENLFLDAINFILHD